MMLLSQIPSADDWFGILILALLLFSIAVIKALQWREARREYERRTRDRRGAMELTPHGVGILERRVGDRRKSRRRG